MASGGFADDDGHLNLLQKPTRTAIRRKCRRMAVILFRFAGNLPVVFAWGIIAALVCSAVFLLIPSIYKSLIMRLFLYSIASCLSFWVCRSLYLVLTAPFVTVEDYFEQKLGSDTGHAYFCAKCNKRAPMNAHHCAVCDACIVEHDHHCVFMNRCIGAGNLNHFYSFLHSCIVSTAALLVICIPLAVDYRELLLGMSQSKRFLATASILLTFVVLSLVVVMRVVMWNDTREASSV